MTTQRRFPPQRRIDGDMQEMIEEKALRDHRAPAQIHRWLEQQAQKGGPLEGRYIPHPKTVQRIVKDVKPPDPSGVWRLANAEPDDARAVLEVLGVVMEETEGRKRQFTNTEAEWVAKIRRIADDLDLSLVWRLAQAYMITEAHGIGSGAMDAYLALSAWRDEDAQRKYLEMLHPGPFIRYALFRGSPLAVAFGNWDQITAEGGSKALQALERVWYQGGTLTSDEETLLKELHDSYPFGQPDFKIWLELTLRQVFEKTVSGLN